MKRPATISKHVKMAAGRLAMKALLRLSGRLTTDRIERWGNKLGSFIFIMSRRYRRVAIRNLTAAYPDWNAQQVRDVARQSFQHFGRGVLEFFHLLKLSSEEVADLVTVEGKEHLDAARARGRGVIVVTAHLGNWEYLARKLVLMGHKLSVIARDSDDPTMTGITNNIREKGGYRVLGKDSAALPALRCLRRNELLGILPDQNTYVGIFVDFFGRPAATATGPAVLSIKSGAPIICGFNRRVECGRFVTVLQPPIDPPTSGDEEADVRALTIRLTQTIEEAIREDPAQWLWCHDRWKRASEASGSDISMGSSK